MAYVQTRLGRWFYEEHGHVRREGDAPIVLLHSLLCDGGMWRAQLGPLAGIGRCVVFDGPGHGHSEVPPPFTLEDNTLALVDALRELGIESAVFVGLSWGGMLAMRMAILHPERVRAMALIDTSAEPHGLAERVKYRAFVGFARRFGLPPKLVDRELAPQMFSERTLRERPELKDQFARTVNGYPREGTARASLAVAVRRKSITDRLGLIRAPTLVVCGREDRATPPRCSEAIASRIKGARLVWIDDAGHLSAVERPLAVNAALVPFVQGHASARPEPAFATP
jgi:3-oxoadipate enol-lactonase